MFPKQMRLRSQSWQFLLLLFVLLALFVWAYQPARRIDIDLTARSNEKFLDHFYPAENGARWTEGRSGIWLPGLGGGNLSWGVHLTLSGPPPGRFATAPHVTVRVDGVILTEFDARNQDENYEWQIRPWQLGVNGGVLLEIESSTFNPGSDERGLGVRVARVWLTRGDGFALPSLRGLSLAVAFLGCCALLLRAVSAVGFRSSPAMTRWQSVNPFHNPRAWVLVALWFLIAFAFAWNPSATTWWLQILTVGLLLGTALTWLIARVVRGSLTRDQAVRVLIVFAIATLVRIPLDAGSGYEGDIASYGKQGDIATYIALAWKTVGHGIQSAYLEFNGSPPSDNPPVLLYPFWFFGWLYQKLISPLFGRTQVSYPDLLRFMLRLPALIADLLAGALVFRVLRQRQSISFNAALFAASIYLFNPALIFDSTYWGQTQAIHALFMLLSLSAIYNRAYGWAGAALAAAVLTKPQALAIAPLVLLFAFRDRAVLRCLGAAAGATLLINLPFLLAGNIGTVLQEYADTTRFHPFIAVNAHNLWWFVTGGKGWSHDTDLVGPLTFRTAGFLLFSCAMLLSLLVVWRDWKKLFLVAAYEALAFFMLNTQIHENHLLAMFAPLVIAAALNQIAWWFYCAFALSSVANMILHDPKLFAWLGYPPNEIYGGPALAGPRLLNAGVQTVLFAAFTVWLAKPLVAQLRSRSSRVEK